jgi:hypothetical protein
MKERGNNHIKVRKVFEQQNWLLLFAITTMNQSSAKEWSNAQNALAYLNVVDNLTHRTKVKQF